jgi:hypothetical protein
MSKPTPPTTEQIAWLKQKMSTERGQWELLHPGACYECSRSGGIAFHDYDRGCPSPKRSTP